MPRLLCRAHRELCSVLRPVVHKLRAHVAVTTKFCTLAHIISGSSVRNLLLITHFTLLAPRTLTWLLDQWKICEPLTQHVGEFLMPSDFGEQYHSDTILQQEGAKRLRIFTLHFGTSSIESFHANELAEASLEQAISLP